MLWTSERISRFRPKRQIADDASECCRRWPSAPLRGCPCPAFSRSDIPHGRSTSSSACSPRMAWIASSKKSRAMYRSRARRADRADVRRGRSMAVSSLARRRRAARQGRRCERDHKRRSHSPVLPDAVGRGQGSGNLLSQRRCFTGIAPGQAPPPALIGPPTFHNEIGALRMKGERLLAADIPCGLDGAKVALQQERSDWQAHSDQTELDCRWEARRAG